MKIRRFVAKDMRTALAQIKEELGVDAVIMSNKKIPEGVELMAAVDYNQAVPEAKPVANTPVANNAMANNHSDNVATSAREVSNDVVSLGQQNAHYQAEANPNAQQSVTEQDTANAPVDSLSALLNRQVQQQVPAQPNEMPNNLDEITIEQQLKNFTDRLSHSTANGIAPQDNNITSSNFSPNDESITSVNTNAVNANVNSVPTSPLAQDIVSDAQVSTQDFAKMQQEMASIRSLLEHQVSGLMVGHVEDIQGCADEASTASSEIASVSNKLSELSSELEEIASQFKV